MSSSLLHIHVPTAALIITLVFFSLNPLLGNVYATTKHQRDILDEKNHDGLGKTPSIGQRHCALVKATPASCKSVFLNSLTRLCRDVKQKENRVQREKGKEDTSKDDVRSGQEVLPEAKDVQRLLYTCYKGKSRQRFGQYFLKNNTVRPFSYMLKKLNQVTDIYYVWTIHRLIVSRKHPGAVFSTPLDGLKLIRLKGIGYPRCLGVDEIRRIIFLAHEGDTGSQLSKMTINGKNWKTFLDKLPHGGHPKSLTVDSIHMKLYWTDMNHVMTICYDGKGYHLLFSGNDVFALAVNPSDGILYYHDKMTMPVMSLHNTSKIKQIGLRFYPRKFLFCENRIYVSPYSGIGKVGFVQDNIFSPLLPPSECQKGLVIVTAWRCEHR